MLHHPLVQQLAPPPPIEEEYFEWIDLLETVAAARGAYTFMELGAGQGRWSVRAAQAAARAGLPYRLIAVEAEPTHCRAIRPHFRAHGIDPAEQEVYWAAVTPYAGVVRFHVGEPDTWWGQSVARGAPEALSARALRRLRARAALGLPPAGTTERSVAVVPAMTLADLVIPHPLIDLIDLDIQGVEGHVLKQSLIALNPRVRRVHVGTHTANAEAMIREAFTRHGWRCLFDFPAAQTCDTPYGLIWFQDGVQTWLNPRLE